jgi:DNA end-binding protein Ku
VKVKALFVRHRFLNSSLNYFQIKQAEIMRAIWTGAIGFGLVNIPVKLFSATQQSEIDLDMLDKKDHANIKFQRVNANTGEEVSWENIVKGYKIDNEYVILDDEDFEKASPEQNKIIEISEFVDETEIDSIYYETPYYLQPEKSLCFAARCVEKNR